MDVVPSLTHLCVAAIVQQCEGRNVEKVLEIFARVDLQLSSMFYLREFAMRKLNDYFPMLIERYSEEAIQDIVGPEVWLSLKSSYDAAQKEKWLFMHLKGSPLERTVVDFVEGSEFYPLNALEAGVEWPKNVEAHRREAYLSDEDFFRVFGMTKADFYKLSKYVRIRMKKEKNLF